MRRLALGDLETLNNARQKQALHYAGSSEAHDRLVYDFGVPFRTGHRVLGTLVRNHFLGEPALDLRALLKSETGRDIDVDQSEILDIVLTQIARNASIVICGAISQYNSTTGVRGPANYMSLLVNRASMTGMLVFDYASRYPEAMREMAGWLAAGKLKTREDIVAGLETFPETLLKLFRGENFGKLVLKV